MTSVTESFAAGYASLSAWADLLDRINVFPVADGDTGTNLRISLAPLRAANQAGPLLSQSLPQYATGNSGNIAAAFFQEFCQAEQVHELADTAASGRDRAWHAIADPCPGTMLSVFDALAANLSPQPDAESLYSPLCASLQEAVCNTRQQLPDLKLAGVVDSGALAMYVFFDAFFHHLTAQPVPAVSIFKLFEGNLEISDSYVAKEITSHCVDVVVQANQAADSTQDFKNNLTRLGESVVVVEDEAAYKVHLHTPDPVALRNRLDSLGNVMQWSEEKIVQSLSQNTLSPEKASLHLVTDAAGSLSKKLAAQLNITLLDSYIVMDGNSRPESLCQPEEIYARMRKGEKVTTAQASTFERHQFYRSICEQYGPTLYLCVGSAFTGNYATAAAWKEQSGHDGQFHIIDTGAASGRLALMALTTARYSRAGADAEKVATFARRAMSVCEEYVFIDELKYLVAGGRLKKTSGFFGDLLNMKPIISPTSEGAQKRGVVRSRKGQLAFALEKLQNAFHSENRPLIMLQYSDNMEWVETVAQLSVLELFPRAEILLTPLSLTSGVHMGPGTWSVAFSPEVVTADESNKG